MGGSLLVTNDFPPKIGGIQSYLYEMWRRLPPESTNVFTTSYPGDVAFDATMPFRVMRGDKKYFAPTRSLTRTIRALVRDIDPDVLFIDPMLPMGHVAPGLGVGPYVVVLHGGEVILPGRTLPP